MDNQMNVNIIEETLNIEEKILNSLFKISSLEDFSDVNLYEEELKKLKLFHKKEKYLVSKIPDDAELYSEIIEILKTYQFGLENEPILKSRFRNIIYNAFLNLKPEIEYDEENDEEVVYDERIEVAQRFCIRTNHIAEYIKSFDDPLKLANKKATQMFNKIRLMNIFLYENIYDTWSKHDYDFDRLTFYNDKQMAENLDLSEEEYTELKIDVLLDDIANLLSLLLTDDKNAKNEIKIQDYYFNFRFLLKKLPTNKVLIIKSEIEKASYAIEKYPLYKAINNALDNEISTRDDAEQQMKVVEEKLESNSEENNSVDQGTFNQVIRLIKLEDKLVDCFMNIDISAEKADMKAISQMIEYEKKLINEIEYSPSLLSMLGDLFSNSIWIYLTGNINEKATLITNRLSNLLPVYKEINISPSQNYNSYNFIYKNHLIRSLRKLWSLSLNTDQRISEGFQKLYKDNYFTNPSLTDDLVSLNGNHSLIFDLSPDLSGIPDYEFNYDQNEQLFKMGCKIIMYVTNNEEEINTISDFAEFQFKINELMDIISNLSSDYNKKLYRFLMDNTSFFSPLRHDLRKIFKEKLSAKKTKTLKKY